MSIGDTIRKQTAIIKLATTAATEAVDLATDETDPKLRWVEKDICAGLSQTFRAEFPVRTDVDWALFIGVYSNTVVAVAVASNVDVI